MRTRHRLPAVGSLFLVFALTLISGSPAKAPGGGAAASSPSWWPLPTAPIPGRLGASAVWTGKAMIVWGGVTRSGLGRAAPRSDGAAYDPATQKWRKIASSPSGVVGGGGSAVAWTGRRMVVWAGNSPDGPTGGAVYDPATNRWRRLQNGPLGAREQYVSVWTDKELLIFGGHAGDGVARPTAAAVDPGTGSWRRLPALDTVKGLAVANGAVWDGREAFVSGKLQQRGQFVRPILFAFNPKTNRLREVNLASAPVAPDLRSQLKPIGWDGTEVVFSTSADTLFSATGVVRYNPTTGRWKNSKPAPCSLPTKTYTQIAWIGNRLVAACGASGLQLYSSRSDSWGTIDTGPSPLSAKGSSAIAWTGTELIVWSGTVRKRHDPTPADGASIRLARQAGATVLQLAFRRAGSANYVWPGDRYVFVEGKKILAHGKATVTPAVLIDEQTGKRTRISGPAGCSDAGIGGPWLLFNCGVDRAELYRLSDGAWRPVMPDPSVVHFCDTAAEQGMCSVTAYAVGTHWVEFLESCYHCAETFVFQNIDTGQLVGDPTNQTTIADLNSHSLAHTVCSPLRVSYFGGDYLRWGTITFYGPFAIASVGTSSGAAAFVLERCGSRLQEPLMAAQYLDPWYCLHPDCRPAANTDVVIWQAGSRQLSGIFLSSQQQFVVPVPAAVASPGLSEVVLSARTLYVLDQSDRLWTAASP